MECVSIPTGTGDSDSILSRNLQILQEHRDFCSNTRSNTMTFVVVRKMIICDVWLSCMIII